MSRAAGADGQADADLARPLGDRDEHDVHDADAADEQRNAGDRAEQQRHHQRDDPQHVGDFGRVVDGEIVLRAAADAMPLPQQLR